ncbi:MAG TPA: phage recombination protein Bet [Streptosporangiaceae bacterium]|nr:phage recombination protein Bet [Streptosporangiaceae bacterium]
MTALAIRDDQTQFDEFQIAVLRQAGVDEDCTSAELAAFMHTCQRRRLDPFTGQIVLIGRYDRVKNRKAYKAQTSIDGFRLIARRAADHAGVDYGYEATVWFDAKGTRHEAWLSPEPPAAAKVVIIRNGKSFDAVARYGAYVQTTKDGRPQGQWQSMPDVMIAKCAEALALRKAFPEDLGGLYTADEMAQADNDAPYRPEPAVTVRAEVTESTTDQGWLDAALEQAATFATEDAGRNLWRTVAAKKKAGQCSATDAGHLGDLITARIDDLHRPVEEVTPSAVIPPGTPAQETGVAASRGQIGVIHAHFKRLGYEDHEGDREERLVFTGRLAGTGPLETSSSLTSEQARHVAKQLEVLKDRAELVALLHPADQGAAA